MARSAAVCTSGTRSSTLPVSHVTQVLLVASYFVLGAHWIWQLSGSLKTVPGPTNVQRLLPWRCAGALQGLHEFAMFSPLYERTSPEGHVARSVSCGRHSRSDAPAHARCS